MSYICQGDTQGERRLEEMSWPGLKVTALNRFEPTALWLESVSLLKFSNSMHRLSVDGMSDPGDSGFQRLADHGFAWEAQLNTTLGDFSR